MKPIIKMQYFIENRKIMKLCRKLTAIELIVENKFMTDNEIVSYIKTILNS